MKKKINILMLLVAGLALVSCNNEPTLQSYYVDHQDNKNFMILDLPASLLLSDNSQLEEKDQKVIKSIKKAVVLALPLNGNNQEIYEKERDVVEKILDDKKYNLLMRMGSVQSGVRIAYLGEEDAIDEIIVYGNDEEKGFALARVLGDNMNVGEIMKLAKSVGNGEVNVNINSLEPLMDMLGNQKDSLNNRIDKKQGQQEVIKDASEDTIQESV
ncbi:DUF4252 domain-containing protein [Mesonia ostreae]|uniref:DUF4252 domain-containing protein n=1 Tax=Mesonia ostreae TaxID=861110 RepID=A0ABU2KLP0_9FLAO|nr:DUF4252 domain-containing protein [Mesonia ostreae]MDT0295640.1 DUF4252 domain-containing protein [Mesonia ostreae]